MNAAATAIPRVFVGRTRERDLLSRALDEASRSHGSAWLACGEAGIGKSRLLGEFAAEAEGRGASVHWGLAWESGGAPAYWPWIQVLRSVVRTPAGEAALAEAEESLPALAQLVPELRRESAVRAPALAPEQARFRLLDAVCRLLKFAAGRGALVIAVEDLHAADPDSLVLFDFVARQVRDSGLLLIATHRDAGEAEPRIAALLGDIKPIAAALHLLRLDRDSVRDYLRAATGQRPLEQTLSEIMTLTEGHPLYLAEIVALGLSRGSLRGAPASLAATILERTAHLPDGTRALLRAASVLGRDVPVEALVRLTGSRPADVEERLAPALAAHVIEAQGPRQYRFAHMLVRETFHDALPPNERRALHARRAEQLEGLATEVPWRELARHLEECGSEASGRAVQAWQRAAAQAGARQAFDDAALCYARALEAVGEDRASRAPLLLALAEAQIRAGDLEAGQRNAVAAFEAGRALGDERLMADSALAYGRVFTYGRVDEFMVHLLREALAATGEGDRTRTALLQARLASAMQPAADPTEPMRLAHQAIELARRVNDRQVMLVTLRNAVSALMDFGDPRERLALNREHVALARALGDSSERMRGSMRMVIDALDLGDRETMDVAIAECEQLARELAFPQHRWTVAAFLVLRATMRGEFADAERALDAARRLAERTQDPNVLPVLVVQRLALAEVREQVAEALELCAEVEKVYFKVSTAATFVRPALLGVAGRLQGAACAPHAVSAAFAREVIAFRDPGGICGLADYVTATADRALAADIYPRLLEFSERCGHWGLMGMHWAGPVARVLGNLAALLGRDPAEVDAHFEAALAAASRMQANPWTARILVEHAEVLAARRDASAAARAAQRLDAAAPLLAGPDLPVLRRRADACRARIDPRSTEAGGAAAPAVPEVAGFELRREGEAWVCTCEGRRFSLRDTRGLAMLARLTADPHREFHALDLERGDCAETIDVGDAGELLDERARRAYRQRVDALRSELAEAEARHDLAAAESAREELEALTRELSRAFGVGGRARRGASAAERARVNVQRRIKDAIRRIAAESPAAGRHLEWAVHTGTYCSYRP